MRVLHFKRWIEKIDLKIMAIECGIQIMHKCYKIVLINVLNLDTVQMYRWNSKGVKCRLTLCRSKSNVNRTVSKSTTMKYTSIFTLAWNSVTPFAVNGKIRAKKDLSISYNCRLFCVAFCVAHDQNHNAVVYIDAGFAFIRMFFFSIDCSFSLSLSVCLTFFFFKFSCTLVRVGFVAYITVY